MKYEYIKPRIINALDNYGKLYMHEIIRYAEVNEVDAKRVVNRLVKRRKVEQEGIVFPKFSLKTERNTKR